MTMNKYIYLLRCANRIGIKTLGDLAEYKNVKNIKTNDDLLRSLIHDAIFVK